MELGHFDTHFVKNTRKGGPTGKNFGVFSPRYSWNYILNEKFNPMMVTIRTFFPKSEHFFQFSKRVREASPLLPSYAPVSVAEYALLFLNMPKYPWKCLNKLFWLCQGSEYAWSSYMFDWLLKMPPVLCKLGFWIWHGCTCKRYAEFQMSDYGSIHLNNSWICLNMPYCPSICLNMTDYCWMSLKMPE